MDILHRLVVHHLDKVFTLWNVDPDRYSYKELHDDCYKCCILPLYGIMGAALRIEYELHDSRLKLLVEHDSDVLDMFSFHNCMEDINVYVDIIPPIAVDIPNNAPQAAPETSSVHEEVEYCDVDNEQADGVEVGQNNEDESNEDEDYVYGFSSEDEDWNVNNGNGGLVDEITLRNKHGNRSDDGLSDYSSNDDCGYSSSDCDEDENGDNVEEDDEEEGYYGKVNPKGKRKRRSKTSVVDYTKFGKVFERVEGTKFKLEQFHIFENINKFREILKDYAIQEGFKLKRVKNEKWRVTCKCAAEGCPWRIHASPIGDTPTYCVKTYNDKHDCVRVSHNGEIDSKWLAKKFGQNFKHNPELTAKGLKGVIKGAIGHEPKRSQLYRTRGKAMDEVEGNHAASYGLLPQYANEIRKYNPGSVVRFDHWRPDFSLNPTFRRIFISFEAMRTGFKLGCRPFLGLDGCHLKGPYGGVLLAAIALDANNGLFPVAFGVVESERKDSWKFFLQHLSTVIEADTLDKPWTFMSDMQKGLDQALVETIPQATHRLCCRHLYNAFKRKHPGLMLQKKFWKAVRAYNVVEFQKTMDQMKNISEKAHNWLMNNFELSSWARHAFNPNVKNDHVTNNISESFNNWVGDLRMKPLHLCLDGIRAKMMERIHKRYEQGCAWQGLVTPNVKKKLNNVIAEGRGFSVLVAGRGEFEVTDETCRYVVNLNARICDCMGWQISGLPCKHATAAICYNREKIEAFCDSSYTIDTYMKIHEGIIHPIPDQQLWQPYTGIPLEPPPPRRLPGRPRKNRKRDASEAPKVIRRSYALRCMLCKRTGHNKRTCQRAPTKKERQEEAARESGRESATPSSICKVSQGASQPRQTTQQRGKVSHGPAQTRPATQQKGKGSQGASQLGPNTQQSQKRSGSVVPTTYRDKENACPSNTQTREKGPQISLPQTRKYIPVFAQLGARGSGIGGSQNPKGT